jgi:sporulation protein YlmC with PRC-barrel domain
MTAAFAVILAAAAPMAYGQTTTTVPPGGSVTVTGSTVRTAVTATHLMPGQIRATAMNGATVYDVQDKKIGDVKDIILDREGRVAAVVLDVGAFLGMGGKFVAVGMNDIKVSFDTNNKPKFAVDMTKDQLKSAQAYDLDEKKAATGSSTPPAPRPADRTH